MAATYYRSLAGIRIKQSEATAAHRTLLLEYPVTDAGSGGETVTITVSKAGGALGATAGSTLTQVAGALYELVLHASDLDTTGDLCLVCAGSVDTTVYTGLQVTADDPYAAPPTAAAIADAVLEEVVSGHKAVAGSLAKWVNDVRQATLFGKQVGDTSDNTVTIYDTDGTTALVETTMSKVGTVTTWTPSPLT